MVARTFCNSITSEAPASLTGPLSSPTGAHIHIPHAQPQRIPKSANHVSSSRRVITVMILLATGAQPGGARPADTSVVVPISIGMYPCTDLSSPCLSQLVSAGRSQGRATLVEDQRAMILFRGLIPTLGGQRLRGERHPLRGFRPAAAGALVLRPVLSRAGAGVTVSHRAYSAGAACPSPVKLPTETETETGG